MSSQFGFIDIILLAMFAGFIILRLRNILGRKTGYQGKPINRYFPKGMEVLKDINNNEAIREGNVDEEELEKANKQLNILLKELGFGVLTILPFSPITIPLVARLAKKYQIDIVPEWFKDSLNK